MILSDLLLENRMVYDELEGPECFRCAAWIASSNLLD